MKTPRKNKKAIVWQTLCGVRGAETKYLETYKVLGNPRRTLAIQRLQYGWVLDRSYTKNALAVSRVCRGLSYV